MKQLQHILEPRVTNLFFISIEQRIKVLYLPMKPLIQEINFEQFYSIIHHAK